MLSYPLAPNHNDRRHLLRRIATARYFLVISSADLALPFRAKGTESLSPYAGLGGSCREPGPRTSDWPERQRGLDIASAQLN